MPPVQDVPLRSLPPKLFTGARIVKAEFACQIISEPGSWVHMITFNFQSPSPPTPSTMSAPDKPLPVQADPAILDILRTAPTPADAWHALLNHKAAQDGTVFEEVRHALLPLAPGSTPLTINPD